MPGRLNIRTFILALVLILIICRIDFFINGVSLIFLYVVMLVSHPHFAMGELNFPLLDIIASVILSIIVIGYLLLFSKNIKYLQQKIDFTKSVIIILLAFFIFAPFIADNNPDFQRDLSVTKLLPPLSKVKVLHLLNENKDESSITVYLRVKNNIVKRSFDESIIFVDSIAAGPQITYYQSGSKYMIPVTKVQLKDNIPVVTSKLFILGTDELGRDIFTRLVYGTRISLFVGLGSVVISMLLGLLLGYFSGYYGGFIDAALNRFTDVFLSFPVIFLIILVIALFGSSLSSVIIVLGFTGWMSLFKIVRTEIISLKNKDFFISAKMLGLSNTKLLFNEAVPYIIVPVLVNLVFQYGNVILAEAALSYLGLGTGTDYPSWGAMIESGQNYMSQAWWMIFFPGLALFLTLLTANNFGRKISSHFNFRVNG